MHAPQTSLSISSLNASMRFLTPYRNLNPKDLISHGVVSPLISLLTANVSIGCKDYAVSDCDLATFIVSLPQSLVSVS